MQQGVRSRVATRAWVRRTGYSKYRLVQIRDHPQTLGTAPILAALISQTCSFKPGQSRASHDLPFSSPSAQSLGTPKGYSGPDSGGQALPRTQNPQVTLVSCPIGS